MILQAGSYLIHLCRVWSKAISSSICVLTIFASSISIISDKVRLSFFRAESQNILSILIQVHMLAFCMIIFSFVSFAFSKSIFAMRIPNVTIPHRFRVNFALHPSTLVQPSSLLNFSAFSSFVVCIAMSRLSRVCSARNLVIVMLFSIRWASIVCNFF